MKTTYQYYANTVYSNRTKNVLDFFNSIGYITNINNEQRRKKMIPQNAYYMFLINMGIVLLSAYFLDKYASYTEQSKKKNNRTENVLD